MSNPICVLLRRYTKMNVINGFVIYQGFLGLPIWFLTSTPAVVWFFYILPFMSRIVNISIAEDCQQKRWKG